MENDLTYSLDTLFAYDTGSTDSGIKDEQLRKKIIYDLENMDDNNFRIFISKYIRNKFLSDAALSEGYGLEDVKTFIDWLDEFMGISI